MFDKCVHCGKSKTPSNDPFGLVCSKKHNLKILPKQLKSKSTFETVKNSDCDQRYSILGQYIKANPELTKEFDVEELIHISNECENEEIDSVILESLESEHGLFSPNYYSSDNLARDLKIYNMLQSAKSTDLNEKAYELIDSIITDNLLNSDPNASFEDDLKTYDLITENGFEDYDDLILLKVIDRNVDLMFAADMYKKLNENRLRAAIEGVLYRNDINIDEGEYYRAWDAWNYNDIGIVGSENDFSYVGDIIYEVDGEEAGLIYDKQFFGDYDATLSGFTLSSHWNDVSSIASDFVRKQGISTVIDKNDNSEWDITSDECRPELINDFYNSMSNKTLAKMVIFKEQGINENNMKFYDSIAKDLTQDDIETYIEGTYRNTELTMMAEEYFNMSESKELKTTLVSIIAKDYENSISSYNQFLKYADYLPKDKANEISSYVINKDPAGAILDLFKKEE